MRTILNLNENWLFGKAVAEAPAQMPEDWEQVNVPHSWNAVDGQDGGGDYFRGTCCYVKTIEKAQLPAADCYFLEINGANSSAEVYVNGQSMAKHHGGYSTWRVDVMLPLQLLCCCATPFLTAPP